MLNCTSSLGVELLVFRVVFIHIQCSKLLVIPLHDISNLATIIIIDSQLLLRSELQW